MNKNEPQYKYSNLLKGYKFEWEIWNMLDLSGIDYESNPIIFESNNPKVVEWINLHNQLEGYDILIPKMELKIECKFTLKPIYHSWFVRDWLSRDCNIIVTNNKWNVPYEDRQLLKEKGVKLFETYELYNYLFELFNASTNKYIIFEYVNKSKSKGKYRLSLRLREKDYRIRLKLFLKLIKIPNWLRDSINIIQYLSKYKERYKK